MSAPQPSVGSARSPAARLFGRVLDGWGFIETALVGLLGATALIAGTVQVVGRYVSPENAIGWAEEVIVYLIIWAVMIVASQLVRSDGHVRPDLVLRLLPPQGQRVAEIFNCLVAIIFTGCLAWYGWEIVDTAMVLDERSSTDLQFPMWIYYAALPTGGALMCLRYVVRLLRFLLFYDPVSMTIGHAIQHEIPANMDIHIG